MNTFSIFISLLISFFPLNKAENNITAEEVAKRYCSCAQENNLTVAAKSYTEAKDSELKEKAKGDYIVAMRKTQECIKMDEVQLSVRQLPKEQRAHFEKNVMKILTESCGEVAAALQILR